MQRSLRSRVLALAGLAVLGAAALLALAGTQTLTAIEDDVERAYGRLADTLAASLGREILADLEVLQGARGTPAIDLTDSDLGAARRALAAAVPQLRVAHAVCFVSASGEPLVCDPPAAGDVLGTADAREALAVAVRSNRPGVTSFISPGAARTALEIVPMTGLDGQPQGAVVAAIEAAGPRLMGLLPAQNGLALGLTDRSGALAFPAVLPAKWSEAAVPGTSWSVRAGATQQGATDALRRLRFRTLWLAPLATAIAMALAYGLALSITHPLASLTRDAERIASGDLSRPIAAGNRDEVGRLASALEAMRISLKESMESVQRQLLRKVIAAQEDERRRVARELHDDTSQLLAALAIRLQNAPPEVSGLIDQMHETLHRIIVNLRPSVLDDLGLGAAIQWLAEHHLKPAAVAVRCELPDLHESRTRPEIEIAIFRVVQEALTNVARHARASTVLIEGAVEGNRIWIQIEDDGDGFDVRTVRPRADTLRGIGLLGMRERMQIVGGSLQIDSAVGLGTRVYLEVRI
jgi:signal transduction histidine kinase